MHFECPWDQVEAVYFSFSPIMSSLHAQCFLHNSFQDSALSSKLSLDILKNVSATKLLI